MWSFISQFLPDGMTPDDLYTYGAGILAVITIAVVANSFMQRDRFASRIRMLHERRMQLKSEMAEPGKRVSRNESSKAGMNVIRLIVDKLQLLQKSQVGKIQQSLINAGFRSKDAIFVFAFFQLIMPIVFLVVAIVVSKINLSQPFLVKWKPLVVVGSAYFGLKFPSIIVSNARNKRYQAVQKGLADTLDLMMICAEAGLSLAASLDRVARELGTTYPILAEEWSITAIEMGFLPDRKKALTNLAERVDMQEVRGITSVLIQTDKYGTPVAQALRVLASEFRTQRMLRAEQKAARLPAIMTVPMIVFILPTLFIMVMAPAIIQLMNKL